MTRRILLLAMLLMSLGRPATAAASPGRFEQFRNFPSRFVDPRNVTVWLPAGYDPDGGPYAVIYMQDGQNLFAKSEAGPGGTWNVDDVLTGLIDAGRVRRAIVVGIWNTPKRLREYMPASVFAGLPADYRARLSALYSGEPLSDAYLKFMVHELKPFIDRRYRTSRKPSDTIAMGSSMGGLISLYALTEYPGVFGAAGCLSSHWPLFLPPEGEDMSAGDIETISTAFEDYLAASLPRPGRHRIWFDHGDRTLDRLYAPFQRRIDRAMASHGWRPGRDFVSTLFPGAAHDERSWRARLDQPLVFLLK